MTLWLAISQRYPQGSCITSLSTYSEPLLRVRLLGTEMDKEKKGLVINNLLGRSDTYTLEEHQRGRVLSLENGTQHSSACHTSVSHIIDFQTYCLAESYGSPRPPPWRFQFSETEEEPTIYVFCFLPTPRWIHGWALEIFIAFLRTRL